MNVRTYATTVGRGFRTADVGVAMHRGNDEGYNRSGSSRRLLVRWKQAGIEFLLNCVV